MMRRFRAWLAAAVLLASVLGFGGCGSYGADDPGQGYVVYYYDSQNMELATEECEYNLYFDDDVLQAASLLYQMLYPDEGGHRSVFVWNSQYRDSSTEQRRRALNSLFAGEIPEVLGLSSIQKDNQILNLWFKDEGYYEMNAVDEAICRAAIVQTLLQIPLI